MAMSRKMVLLLGAEAVSAFMGWLAVKLVLREMGEAALGELAFALSLVGGFTFLALLGFRQAHIKRVSEGRDLGRCLGTFAAIRVLQLALLVGAVLGALALRLYVWDKPIVDAPVELILIILVYWLLFYVAGIANATFTALEESSKLTVPTLAGNLVRLGLMCGAALLGWSVLWLGWAYVLGTGATLALFVWLLRGYPLARPRRPDYESYWRYAKPLMVVTVISTAALYADKVVLGVFATKADLGAFYALQRLAALLMTLTLAMETLLFPQLSRLHASGAEPTVLGQRVHLTERWLALAAVPLVAVVWALPDPVIRVLLTAPVANATGFAVLRLLSLVGLLRILARPYGVTLRAIDRPDLSGRVWLVGGLAAIALNFLLIPGHLHYLDVSMAGLGAEGAGWALFISALIGYGLNQYYTRQELGLTVGWKMVSPLAAGVATVAALGALDAYLWDITRWYELAGAGLAGLALFWSLMAAMGQVSWADLQLLREALHPGEMGRYVVGELKERKPKEGQKEK